MLIFNEPIKLQYCHCMLPRVKYKFLLKPYKFISQYRQVILYVYKCSEGVKNIWSTSRSGKVLPNKKS